MMTNTAWKSRKRRETLEDNVLSGKATYLSVPMDNWYSGIGEFGISYFPNLEEVYIPSICSLINPKAFKENPKLKKVVIAKKPGTLTGYPWGLDPKKVEIVFDPSAKPKHDEYKASPLEVPGHTTTPEPTNYRKAMLQLIREMREYLDFRNYPGFQLVANGGIAIFKENPERDWTKREVTELAEYISAVTIEDVFYGTDWEWGLADDQETPEPYTKEFLYYMDIAQKLGVRPMVIDYCSSPAKIARSFELCKAAGYADFVATERNLTTIPTYSVPHNQSDCYSLKKIQSYLVLLNPNRYPDPVFSSREDYLRKMCATWYDCFVIDNQYGGELFTAEEIARLRRKPDGSRRMVGCYMSLGEAEVVRPYWNPKWSNFKPDSDDPESPNYMPWSDAVSYCDWIAEPNPQWIGAYKVKYWTDEWKKVLFGTEDSILDLIVRANFDFVFLDVIDAYSYFEEKADEKKG